MFQFMKSQTLGSHPLVVGKPFQKVGLTGHVRQKPSVPSCAVSKIEGHIVGDVREYLSHHVSFMYAANFNLAILVETRCWREPFWWLV